MPNNYDQKNNNIRDNAPKQNDASRQGQDQKSSKGADASKAAPKKR